MFGQVLGALLWGAADAEIKVSSIENYELKGSVFKARGKSVYSHTTYAYCQGFLANFYPSGPFTCIFSKTFFGVFFLCWLWLTLVPMLAHRIKS